MNSNISGLGKSYQTGTSLRYRFFNYFEKPLEIYVYVDPLCPECWSLEPYLKKLTIEYGRYFTIRPIISGHFKRLNRDKFDQPKKIKAIWEHTANRTGMSCNGDIWTENPVSSPWVASVAIKAAELQGKKAGKVYLRKIQESVFLKKEDISNEKILMDCARETHLDLDEFERDLYSVSAQKAVQCDLKLTKEMEVEHIPTLVVFNHDIEEHGMKISGLYSYEIYERLLKQMLQKNPVPAEKPPLKNFLSHFGVVGNKEIAVVYDWSIAKTNCEMKKLQLQQAVEKIPTKQGPFWKYIR
ncbi:MAG TPA: ClpXP adapter SpxH family protein [Bacillota bacterium]|nr:ClpXP adapter SpxH family protein [Bacillota bacterium]